MRFVQIACVFAASICFTVGFVKLSGLFEVRVERLEVDPPSRDLGAVAQSPDHEILFFLTNRFSHPVTLEKPETSCSCTDTRLDRRTLKPGETGVLTSRWNTRGLRGDQYSSIELSYSLDNGLRFKNVLMIHGDVQPTVICTPAELDFHGASQDRIRVELSRRPGGGGLDPIIQDVRFSHRAFRAVNQTASSFVVELDPEFLPEVGSVAYVDVLTSEVNDPSVRIPISVGQ